MRQIDFLLLFLLSTGVPITAICGHGNLFCRLTGKRPRSFQDTQNHANAQTSVHGGIIFPIDLYPVAREKNKAGSAYPAGVWADGKGVTKSFLKETKELTNKWISLTARCVSGSLGAHEAFSVSDLNMCGSLWQGVVVNRLVRGQTKTRASVRCTALWSTGVSALVCVCVCVCGQHVGVRDSVGVACSTGRACGKHCMHNKDRWKGRGGCAGSEQQKRSIIWFVWCVQIELIRLCLSESWWREGAAGEPDGNWKRQTEGRCDRNGERTMTERDKCTSGRELAVNNEKPVTTLCTW